MLDYVVVKIPRFAFEKFFFFGQAVSQRGDFAEGLGIGQSRCQIVAQLQKIL